MAVLIQPRLTLATRVPTGSNMEHYRSATCADSAVPVVVPVLSRRVRVAVTMQLLALWLVESVACAVLWQFGMQAIYCFVCVLIVFLVGCMFTGLIVAHHYRTRLAGAPLLMTQKVKAVKRGDLAQLTQAVTMDTERYLEAVRILHE